MPSLKITPFSGMTDSILLVLQEQKATACLRFREANHGGGPSRLAFPQRQQQPERIGVEQFVLTG